MRAHVHSTRSALLASRARDMRFAPTPSEERLWLALRGSQLGVAFRRQVPIGHYIAEVDGSYHTGRERADARRDEALRRAGYRVVHVPAELVHRDLSAAVARIRAALWAVP